MKNRISILASYCEGSKSVCDIGCDHAYVLIEAILKYGVEKGIACDIREEPLKNAQKNVKKVHLEKQIEFVLSDGLKDVYSSFDTAILAGMGGNLICRIMEQAKDRDYVKWILQANSDRPMLRRFLQQNGFKILEETALYEQDKYYEIIIAEKGENHCSEIDNVFGPILRVKKEPAYIRYYHSRLKKIKEIVQTISDSNKKKEFLEEIAKIKQVLGE